MKELRGRTAVVTGAASGMGLAFSRRFAAAGMNVVMADIEDPPLLAAAEELRATGAAVHATRFDASSAADNQRLLDETVARFGAANVVCLNAGVANFGSMLEQTAKDWDWCLGVNLLGVGYGVSVFAPHLVAHGDGHVVITASVAGHTTSPRLGIYNASKHGAVAIAETLQRELLGEGSAVGVTCLCPGIINTNILESARNRPETFQEPGMEAEPTEEEVERRALLNEVFAAGMPPEDVADMVHDAVLSGQFWLFTDHAFDAPIAARHEEIRTRSNPDSSAPLVDLDRDA
jgi:NAD(P)-dependent dehydrogenase (short-subunit alcohol dehydrogenase family)